MGIFRRLEDDAGVLGFRWLTGAVVENKGSKRASCGAFDAATRICESYLRRLRSIQPDCKTCKATRAGRWLRKAP